VLKVFVELHPAAFPPGANLNAQTQQEIEAQLSDFLRSPQRRYCFLPSGLRVHCVEVEEGAIPNIVQASEMPNFNGNGNGHNRLAG
jgi:hypothetical protein